MNHRDIKGGEMVTDNDTMFFYYDGQLLGKCSADYTECDALLELMRNNSDVATGVLNYMNSLGDPVFPVSDDDWGIAETDIRNVDIYDLYDAFMQELNYQYSDWGEVYVDQIPGVEIWASESSTVAASTNPKYFANMVSADTHINDISDIQNALSQIRVRDFYVDTYPNDDLGHDIGDATFYDVLDALIDGIDVYDVIGVGDSVIRERVFKELSQLIGVSYDVIYNLWLNARFYSPSEALSIILESIRNED